MNVITSVRIIGNHNDIRRFIYDNIQINDPTEEDYKHGIVNASSLKMVTLKKTLCSFYYSCIKCFY